MTTDQLEFAASTQAESQCDKLLRALKSEAGQWISLPSLVYATGGFAVHSRISDLRKAGHMIDHKNERAEGKTHSFYRLIA